MARLLHGVGGRMVFDTEVVAMRNDKLGATWSVILAAGEGSRMTGLTRAIHGAPIPKQFVSFTGGPSLLQRTIERTTSIAPPERTVVVVAEEHASRARAQLAPWEGVEVVAQPANLGTGPGVLLPVAHVRARDPLARVAVFPSDHHLDRPEAMTDAVIRALSAGEAAPSGVAIVGVPADRAATDFGWILAGRKLGSAISGQQVDGFVEKPAEPVASSLLAAGALWNTFIVVGGVAAIWELARRHLPAQAATLDCYRRTLGRPCENDVLAAAYRELVKADFSRDVLERAQGLAVVPMIESGWSDWGTPERLFESLDDSNRLHPVLRELFERSQHAGAGGGCARGEARLARAAA